MRPRCAPTDGAIHQPVTIQGRRNAGARLIRTTWLYPLVTSPRRHIAGALGLVLGQDEVPGLDVEEVVEAIRDELRDRNQPGRLEWEPVGRILTVWWPGSEGDETEETIHFHPAWLYLTPLNFHLAIPSADHMSC